MIPPVFAESTASPGERDLFERFRNAPGTEDWVVLHSLDLTDHVDRVAGEADFVVVVPRLGVAVLEVKAHHHIAYDDGVWLMGRALKPDVRGPFKQASQAMHSIRHYVTDRVEEARSVPFWSGVVFPYANFDTAPASPEWHDWQLIDAGDLSRRNITDCVAGLLRAARQTLRDRTGWFRDAAPGPALAERIVTTLRPNFEVHETPKQRMKRLEAEVLRYTELQMRALDMVASNDRVLMDGPAGTGKTVLAVESARRAALEGARVLFLCFNAPLAERLASELAGQPQIEVATLHAFMRKMSGVAVGDEQRSDRGFWRSDLPDRAIDALLSRTEAVCDVLILDEAQDVNVPGYLDVLDLALEASLSGGRWFAVGDFANQALYNDGGVSGFDELVRSRTAALARLTLTENCRNTESIATFAEAIGRLRIGYSRVLRSGTGIDADLRFYAASGGPAALARALEDLREDGMPGQETIVLGSMRDGDATRLGEPWESRLVRGGGARHGIRFDTIQRFKGLEASAVIVTDIRDVRSERTRQLLYTASTRAKHRLIVLLPDSEREAVLAALSGEELE